MKSNLVLIILMMAFASSSYAECTKSEVMKLIDKGFSRAEISSICDMGTISSAPKSSIKPKSDWMDPPRKACTGNGGKLVKGGICDANWYSAKRICSTASGRLPTIDELKKVVIECGGEIDDDINNQNDSTYQSCYKQKGFFSSGAGNYWSSTAHADYTDGGAWVVRVSDGYTGGSVKSVTNYVRCVRGRQ